LPTHWREPSKPYTFPSFPYHFDLRAHVSWRTIAHGWVPLSHDVTGEANCLPNPCAGRLPLQLCLDTVQATLVTSEHEMATTKDVAAEA
jgi:hypothetical protein